MRYNKEVFKKFRDLAVTDLLLLVPGKTYYSNSYPAEFTVKELISTVELYKRQEVPIYEGDSSELGWVVWGDSPYQTSSLHDHNIGASYNPWLIFEDKETRDKCLEELVVTFPVGDGMDWDDELYMLAYEEMESAK